MATTNPGKIREIRQLLAGLPFDLLTLDAWPHVTAPEETGQTFEENARAKALYYAAATGELTVAEDSGLAIDALDGAPGVESARYGGADLPYPAKFALIHDALRAKHAAADTGTRHTARFVCAVALAQGERILFETRGTVEGEIAAEARGSGGFGYDPVFLLPSGSTTAELPDAEKDRISHRGRAVQAAMPRLRELMTATPTAAGDR